MSESIPEELSKQPLFRDFNADDDEQETTIIESICIHCFKDGVTRLLLTKIPFYKEVVLMSFNCEHCGYQNNEIQSAGEIQPKGCKYTVNIKNSEDLNRRVVKSDYASVKIPEQDLEIEAQSQKGEITTVEGIIDRAITGLSQDQERRKVDHPEVAANIDSYIQKLTNLKDNFQEFTLIIEDISGNSFVQNPLAPQADPETTVVHFTRTKEQDEILGLYSDTHTSEEHLLKPIEEGSWPLENLEGEVIQFPTNCPSCRSPCVTNMKVTNIPHFKEVIIMATVCDVCGVKTNEVKSGGGIEEKGIRFEVKVENKEDLMRDVLKSETCSLLIPDFDCDVGPHALGGRFTTVEGIIAAIKDQLESNGAMFRDSADDGSKKKFENFIAKIDEVVDNKRSVTLVLDDPAGNSYVQSLVDDDQKDPKLKVERYVRDYDQNEELGLNDIKTEGYENAN